KLELTTAEMIRTKDEHPTALTVVQDPTGCSAFGGCPYQGLCKLTPQEKLKAMVKQVAKESGVLGKLAARKAAKSGKAPATTAATTTTVEESKATETVETKGETVAVENEATDAKVNPPENEDAPVVTVETIEAEKAA